MMEPNCTKMLLVSANVGSIFEDPEKMLKMWLKEFLSTVKMLDPGFLAIHCQEVGGKNYEVSMQHVNSFIKSLLASEEMEEFDRARLFLDEDFTAVDQFTALGNLYFIHRSVRNVQIYDFEECKFVPLEGREVLSGNIAAVSIKEKAKFPQEFFPDFKWSRKGFIRSRWNIHNSIFDLVNIHLFHDASNIVAMESSPSQYSCNRQRTLQHTLERLENDKYDNVPIFLFGDFNFRLDTCKLIHSLTQNSIEQKTQGKKNDISKFTYKKEAEDEVILTVEKKGFDHHQHEKVFSESNGQWLQQFDKETDVFRDRLQELDITFPPSYPFSEDVEDGTSYSKTRCPGWCDRIMFTPTARMLMNTDEGLPEYSMMGTHICMGDHKPIYMNLKLRHNTGNASQASESDLPITRHQPLKKVISINGEEVQVSSLDDINIHDYASFEQEEHITRKFMSTIRRKQGLEKKASFRNVVKDVMRAERIMRAMRHYSHRSDSETEDTEDECGKSLASEDDRSLGEPINSLSPDINANVGQNNSKVVKSTDVDTVNMQDNNNSSAPNNNNHVSISDQLNPQLLLDTSSNKAVVSLPNDIANNNSPAPEITTNVDDVKVSVSSSNQKNKDPNSNKEELESDKSNNVKTNSSKRSGKCQGCCVVM